MTSSATVIYVAYNTESLDLSWVPADAPVVVVHNDRTLDPAACRHPRIIHCGTGRNIGFGAGVNIGLAAVDTDRTIVCNPDTALMSVHWQALADGDANQLRTVPLADGNGVDTAIVNPYPTPRSLVATAYRVGRWLPRGSRRRERLLRLLGRWGAAHHELTGARTGEWPLDHFWASGAVFSASTERLRSVGGFDPSYFLYMEDVDLCRRLSSRFPGMRIVMAGDPPGRHGVGGSAPSGPARRAVNRHYTTSAQLYARSCAGIAWRIAGAALAPRARWLAR